MHKQLAWLFSIAILTMSQRSQAQLYFPPLLGNAWETTTPASLGWCENQVDSLYKLLDDNNTKAFIVLKNGKIVIERYFDTFTQDSFWYWASAGKSLTGFITGIAQQQKLLNLQDSSSKYLGKGWSSCTPSQESAIKVWNHLTMTTGLDYTVPNLDCTQPVCLAYKNQPGTAWYYHNAPYHLIQEIVANASGKSFQQFTNQELSTKTGISGFWYNYVFYSKPRVMARFGLLMLNKGVWANDTILSDTLFFNQMVSSSQQHNKSYGYLWWLNGKESFMLPGSTLTFQGVLIPEAPADLWMALGKNDQKLYVWPNQNIVIVRMGDSAGDSSLVPVVFDRLLWGRMNRLFCSSNTGVSNLDENQENICWPNPSNGILNIGINGEKTVEVYNINGQLIYQENLVHTELNLRNIPSGIYALVIRNNQKVFVQKWLKN